MRIRSTKPEFWRSKTIGALPWEVRLVLKGIESYVDDNGVGKDDIALIAADVFPRDLSGSPRETLARLSEAITLLSERGLIVRYEVEGEELIYVDRWKQQQRIDKPGKGRFRRPDGTLEYAEEVDRESYARARETLAPGTGEQGNRGTGEQGSSEADASGSGKPPRAELAVVEDLNAQTLVGEWIDHCAERPPGRVVGQVAKELKALLDEGIDPHRVRAALAEWNRKGLHPSTIPSVVHEITNRAPGVKGQQATDEMFERAMERALAREAAR